MNPLFRFSLLSARKIFLRLTFFIRKNNFSIPFLAIIFLGVALRLYQLGKFDFWYDEVISIIMAKKIPQVFMDYPVFVTTPPLFNIFLRILLFFGDGEFFLRLLPAIFGILSIFMAYKLGEFLFKRKIGLISSFMMSISAFQVYYSQELRAYSLLAFLSLCSIYFLLKSLREGRLFFWIAYIISNALGLYTHNYFGFIIIAQNLFFFIFLREFRTKLKSFLLSEVLVLFLYLPWARITFNQLPFVLSSWHYSWMGKGNLGDILNTFQFFLGGYGPRFIGLFNFLIFMPFFISGFFMIKEKREEVILLSAWIFVPIISVFFLSKHFFPIYLHRALIFIAPAFYILGAAVIAKLKRVFLIIFLAIFSFISFAGLYCHFNDILSREIASNKSGITHKKEHRLSTKYVEANFKAGDTIVHANICTRPSFWFYSGLKMPARKFRFLVGSGYYSDLNSLRQNMKGYDRAWLIYSTWHLEKLLNENEDRIENLIKKWMDSNYDLIDSKTFKGIEVRLYRLYKSDENNPF